MGAAWLALSLLAAAESPPGPAPVPPAIAPMISEIRAALREAAGPIERIGACAERNPRHEPGYRNLFGRANALRDEAHGIFGPRLEVGYEPSHPMPPRCRDVSRDAGTATAALASGEAALRRARARMTGLWIGQIRMCGGAIKRLTAGVDDMDGAPTAQIALRRDAARTFAVETTVRVGMQLAVHLDGRLILNPYVNEPILGGVLQIRMADPAEVETIRAAIDRPC
jgi:hypothetical protein